MPTKIEWTDHTWNPVTGCTKGCKFCYLKRFKRFEKKWGYSLDVLIFHRNHILRHAKWKPGEKVFVCDMGDLFDPTSKYEWFRAVLNKTTQYPKVIFQFLTKQPKRMYEWCKRWCEEFKRKLPKNTWWGTTVINQDMVDENIPEILKLSLLGAIVIYLSAEPMLGPIDLGFPTGASIGPHPKEWGTMTEEQCEERIKGAARAIYIARCEIIDWVICGGMSGPGAVPINPDWARNLRDRCVEANVPFFFKQNGEFLPILHDRYGSSFCGHKNSLTSEEHIYWKEDIQRGWKKRKPTTHGVYLRVGKKNAGRLLDGEKWNQFPEVEL